VEKQHANYVSKIMEYLKGKIFDLAIHKYASNVIEKLLAHGSQKVRKEIIDEIITKDDQYK
jgi:hypothetical protein